MADVLWEAQFGGFLFEIVVKRSQEHMHFFWQVELRGSKGPSGAQDGTHQHCGDSATVMDPIALRTWPVDIKQADFLIKFQVTLRMQGTSLVGRGWQEVRMCVATSHRSILP